MATNKESIVKITQQLDERREEIRKVLPPHVEIDRFERIVKTAIARNQDLLSCDRASLFAAVYDCAQDGLIPDGREAAFVRFKQGVAYIPMVAGLLKLARQSGEIAAVAANVVREGEEFDYWVDETGEHLIHRPDFLATAPGDITAVYAMARTKDGEAIIQVMSVADVERVRSVSRAANSGPWKEWWDQMAIKTAIRRLFKRLPKSTDAFGRAVHRDDALYHMNAAEPVGAVPPAESAVKALSQAPANETVVEQGMADAAEEREPAVVDQEDVF